MTQLLEISFVVVRCKQKKEERCKQKKEGILVLVFLCSNCRDNVLRTPESPLWHYP